jgi:hypothetical protein
MTTSSGAFTGLSWLHARSGAHVAFSTRHHRSLERIADAMRASTRISTAGELERVLAGFSRFSEPGLVELASQHPADAPIRVVAACALLARADDSPALHHVPASVLRVLRDRAAVVLDSPRLQADGAALGGLLAEVDVLCKLQDRFQIEACAVPPPGPLHEVAVDAAHVKPFLRGQPILHIPPVGSRVAVLARAAAPHNHMEKRVYVTEGLAQARLTPYRVPMPGSDPFWVGVGVGGLMGRSCFFDADPLSPDELQQWRREVEQGALSSYGLRFALFDPSLPPHTPHFADAPPRPALAPSSAAAVRRDLASLQKLVVRGSLLTARPRLLPWRALTDVLSLLAREAMLLQDAELATEVLTAAARAGHAHLLDFGWVSMAAEEYPAVQAALLSAAAQSRRDSPFRAFASEAVAHRKELDTLASELGWQGPAPTHDWAASATAEELRRLHAFAEAASGTVPLYPFHYFSLLARAEPDRARSPAFGLFHQHTARAASPLTALVIEGQSRIAGSMVNANPLYADAKRATFDRARRQVVGEALAPGPAPAAASPQDRVARQRDLRAQTLHSHPVAPSGFRTFLHGLLASISGEGSAVKARIAPATLYSAAVALPDPHAPLTAALDDVDAVLDACPRADPLAGLPKTPITLATTQTLPLVAPSLVEAFIRITLFDGYGIPSAAARNHAAAPAPDRGAAPTGPLALESDFELTPALVRLIDASQAELNHDPAASPPSADAPLVAQLAQLGRRPTAPRLRQLWDRTAVRAVRTYRARQAAALLAALPPVLCAQLGVEAVALLAAVGDATLFNTLVGRFATGARYMCLTQEVTRNVSIDAVDDKALATYNTLAAAYPGGVSVPVSEAPGAAPRSALGELVAAGAVDPAAAEEAVWSDITAVLAAKQTRSGIITTQNAARPPRDEDIHIGLLRSPFSPYHALGAAGAAYDTAPGATATLRAYATDAWADAPLPQQRLSPAETLLSLSYLLHAAPAANTSPLTVLSVMPPGLRSHMRDWLLPVLGRALTVPAIDEEAAQDPAPQPNTLRSRMLAVMGAMGDGKRKVLTPTLVWYMGAQSQAPSAFVNLIKHHLATSTHTPVVLGALRTAAAAFGHDTLDRVPALLLTALGNAKRNAEGASPMKLLAASPRFSPLAAAPALALPADRLAAVEARLQDLVLGRLRHVPGAAVDESIAEGASAAHWQLAQLRQDEGDLAGAVRELLLSCACTEIIYVPARVRFPHAWRALNADYHGLMQASGATRELRQSVEGVDRAPVSHMERLTMLSTLLLSTVQERELVWSRLAARHAKTLAKSIMGNDPSIPAKDALRTSSQALTPYDKMFRNGYEEHKLTRVVLPSPQLSARLLEIFLSADKLNEAKKVLRFAADSMLMPDSDPVKQTMFQRTIQYICYRLQDVDLALLLWVEMSTTHPAIVTTNFALEPAIVIAMAQGRFELVKRIFHILDAKNLQYSTLFAGVREKILANQPLTADEAVEMAKLVHRSPMTSESPDYVRPIDLPPIVSRDQIGPRILRYSGINSEIHRKRTHTSSVRAALQANEAT